MKLYHALRVSGRSMRLSQHLLRNSGLRSGVDAIKIYLSNFVAMFLLRGVVSFFLGNVLLLCFVTVSSSGVHAVKLPLGRAARTALDASLLCLKQELQTGELVIRADRLGSNALTFFNLGILDQEPYDPLQNEHFAPDFATNEMANRMKQREKRLKIPSCPLEYIDLFIGMNRVNRIIDLINILLTNVLRSGFVEFTI